MLFRFLLITIFAGSVFLTSGRFVDATNTPKDYFVVVFLFTLIITLMVRSKQIKLTGIYDNKTVFSGIFIVCFAQACYGLCQFVGWLPSNHLKFVITGSFDNPAGFASVLAMGFPLGLFLVLRTKKFERYLSCAILSVISSAVFLSGARTGMLAIVTSSMIFLLINSTGLSNFRQFRYSKLLLVLTLSLFVGLASILYYQKKDSANGRLLVWKVSLEMIKDKHVFGHGLGKFQAKYMDYQAEYFINNPNSKYALLADNVKHPFNEFIKVAVEFGLIGLAVIFSFIMFVWWKIMKSKNETRVLVLSGLASFLVFACFSYPLQYVAVWLLLGFYFSMFLPSKEIVIKNTSISIFTRSMIVIACTFFVVHTFGQIRAEMKWKSIAVSSLKGNTEEMLPEYERLYCNSLMRNPFFLYNYGAELNVAGRFDESISILTECKERFNDYDLQMLLADNYKNKGEPEKAIQTFQYSSGMIPCRFLPLYQIFEIYKVRGKKDLAMKYANEIVNKKVKIPSLTVNSIIAEADEYLKENRNTLGSLIIEGDPN